MLNNEQSKYLNLLGECVIIRSGDNMKNIIEVTDLNIEELLPYRTTAEIQLLRYYEPEPGIFIAESPKVIRRALADGYEPLSMLVEKKYIDRQASDIIDSLSDIPVYTAETELLTQITGFKLTQGALCVMRRKPLKSADEILEKSHRIAVLEDIMNQTNIGAIIRSAAALGIDAVLLTPACSDPLYRRSVRVSMGTVFQVPWTYLPGAVTDMELLRRLGFRTAAMALVDDSVDIDDEKLNSEERLALILGAEGDGLSPETVSASDHKVCIPMSNEVDSLNVAAASAVAFWQICRGKR